MMRDLTESPPATEAYFTYWMEIETVMSYLANSVNPDGVRAQEIIKSLQEDMVCAVEAIHEKLGAVVLTPLLA
jgi:hypothetical protein